MVLEKGAKSVHVCVTHAVLCGRAVEKLQNAPVESIVVTDTIPTGDKKVALGDRLQVLSVADLLGEAVHRIHAKKSVSDLFSIH